MSCHNTYISVLLYQLNEVTYVNCGLNTLNRHHIPIYLFYLQIGKCNAKEIKKGFVTNSK